MRRVSAEGPSKVMRPSLNARFSGSRPSRAMITLLGEMTNAHVTGTDIVDAMFAGAENLTFDATEELASRTLSRKSVAADALIDTVRLALELTGGYGYTRDCDIERLYRDVHGSLFHPLPRAKQLQLTGRVAAGLSPV